MKLNNVWRQMSRLREQGLAPQPAAKRTTPMAKPKTPRKKTGVRMSAWDEKTVRDLLPIVTGEAPRGAASRLAEDKGLSTGAVSSKVKLLRKEAAKCSRGEKSWDESPWSLLPEDEREEAVAKVLANR